MRDGMQVYPNVTEKHRSPCGSHSVYAVGVQGREYGVSASLCPDGGLWRVHDVAFGHGLVAAHRSAPMPRAEAVAHMGGYGSMDCGRAMEAVLAMLWAAGEIGVAKAPGGGVEVKQTV
jgi:hypothetical protein